MAKKQGEKKQPRPLVPSSSKAKKQPPASSPAPSLSTKSLDKSATTGTKQENKLPSLFLNSPSTSSSESSSEGDEPLPPPSSLLKKPAGASTSAVQLRHPEPSQYTDGTETDNESKEEESSDDTASLVAKPNPPPLLQASREGKGKQTSIYSFSSGSASEDGEGDGEEMDSSSESDQPQLNPPRYHAGNMATKKAEALTAGNDSDASSESDQNNSSPHKSSPSAAALLSTKPMDHPAQPVDKNGIIAASPSPISDSKKKRKRANDNSEEAGLEKKNLFKRIWSNEDVLNLLRGILEYKEYHHVVPSSLVQLESVQASIKGSLSVPLTLIQMYDKGRRLKKKYIRIAKGINGSMAPPSLNAYDGAVFDLSKKIWGSSIDGSSVSGQKIKAQKVKDIENVKVTRKEIPTQCPSLHRFIKHEHSSIPSVMLLNHTSNNKSNLDGRCEKLEIEEVQIQIRKEELLAAALRLIEDALRRSHSGVIAGTEQGSMLNPGDL